MRSIFQEESSLGKSVQKAWDALGNPAEFSVKILKNGEFGFFGFCKVPFTVCLTIPEKNTSEKVGGFDKNKYGLENKKPFSPNQPLQNKKNYNEKSSSVTAEIKKEGYKKPENQDLLNKVKASASNNVNSTDKFLKASAPEGFSANKSDDYVSDDWSAELVEVAIKFISEALLLLGHETTVSSSNFEKNQLNLSLALTNFDAHIDRMILFSLAPIIVQMVRKSTQNTIKGLRLTIDVTKKA